MFTPPMRDQKTFEPLGGVQKKLTPMVASPHPIINERPLIVGIRLQIVDIEGGRGVGIGHIKKNIFAIN